MAAVSHEPYYFSTRWTQMVPIFPGPDRVYEVFVLANGFQISHQKQQFILESHQGGPSFQCYKIIFVGFLCLGGEML